MSELAGTTLYRLVDVAGQVLYVGITSDIERRLIEHSTKKWFETVAAVECTKYPSREDASDAEAALIAAVRPRHNRTHNPSPVPRSVKLPPIIQRGTEDAHRSARTIRPPAAKTRRFDAFSARRRYVTMQEAAEYLGVTDRTIRQMIADGRLNGYRSGKRLVRLDLNEIDAAMKPFGGATA